MGVPLYFGSEAARLEAEAFFAEQAEEERARSPSNSRKPPDPEPDPAPDPEQDIVDQLHGHATIQSDDESESPEPRSNLGSAAPPFNATRARRLRRQTRNRNSDSNLNPTPSEAAGPQRTPYSSVAAAAAAAAGSERNEQRAEDTDEPPTAPTSGPESNYGFVQSYAARVAEIARQRQQLSDRIRQRILPDTPAGLPAGLPADAEDFGSEAEATFMVPPIIRSSTMLHDSQLRNELLAARDTGRRNREDSAAGRAANHAASSASRSPTTSRLSSRFAPAHRHQQQNAQSDGGATAPPPPQGDERLRASYPPLPWDDPQHPRPMSPFSRQYNEDLRHVLHHFIEYGTLPDILPLTLQQRDRERAEARAARERARELARERRLREWGVEPREGSRSASLRQVVPERTINEHTLADNAAREGMWEYEALLRILSGTRGGREERRRRVIDYSDRTGITTRNEPFQPPQPPVISSPLPSLNSVRESIQPSSRRNISAPQQTNADENEIDPHTEAVLAWERHRRSRPYVSIFRPPRPYRNDPSVDDPNDAYTQMLQAETVYVHDPPVVPGQREIIVVDPIPDEETPVENSSVPVDTTPAPPPPPPPPAQQETTLTRSHHHHHHWHHHHHHHYPGSLPEDENEARNRDEDADDTDNAGHPRTGDDASDVEFTMTRTHHPTGETSNATRPNIR